MLKKIFLNLTYVILVIFITFHISFEASCLPQEIVFLKKNAYFNYLHHQHTIKFEAFDIMDVLYKVNTEDPSWNDAYSINKKNIDVYLPTLQAANVWIYIKLLLDLKYRLDNQPKRFKKSIQKIPQEYVFLKKNLNKFNTIELKDQHVFSKNIYIFLNRLNELVNYIFEKKMKEITFKNMDHILLDIASYANASMSSSTDNNDFFYKIFANDLLSVLHHSHLVSVNFSNEKDGDTYCNNAERYLKKYHQENFAYKKPFCRQFIETKNYASEIEAILNKKIPPQDTKKYFNTFFIKISLLFKNFKEDIKNNFFLKNHPMIAKHFIKISEKIQYINAVLLPQEKTTDQERKSYTLAYYNFLETTLNLFHPVEFFEEYWTKYQAALKLLTPQDILHFNCVKKIIDYLSNVLLKLLHYKALDLCSALPTIHRDIYFLKKLAQISNTEHPLDHELYFLNFWKKIAHSLKDQLIYHHEAYGGVLVQTKNFVLAKEVFDKGAAFIKSGDAQVQLGRYWSTIAEKYLQNADPIQYLDYTLKAIAEDSSNTDYLVQAGRAYLRLENIEQAKAYFDKALCLDPLHKKAHTDLAQLYLQQERWDEAAKHFLSVINHSLNLNQDPKDADIVLNTGIALLKQNQTTQGVHYLKAAAESLFKRYNAEFQFTVAQTLEHHNEHSEALTYYKRAQYLNPHLQSSSIATRTLGN